MTAKKRRRKKPKTVPRLGPATNLRPAGPHESLKRYNRKRSKAEHRDENAAEPDPLRDESTGDRY